MSTNTRTPAFYADCSSNTRIAVPTPVSNPLTIAIPVQASLTDTYATHYECVWGLCRYVYVCRRVCLYTLFHFEDGDHYF